MSLLNGFEKNFENSVLDVAIESTANNEMDFEFALESVVDTKLKRELSESDIEAILDDSNPDNIASDLSLPGEDTKENEPDINPTDIEAIDMSEATESTKEIGCLESLLGLTNSEVSNPDDSAMESQSTDENPDEDIGGEEDDPAVESIFKDFKQNGDNKKMVLEMDAKEVVKQLLLKLKNNKYCTLSKSTEAKEMLNEVHKQYEKSPGHGKNLTSSELLVIEGYPMILTINKATEKFRALSIVVIKNGTDKEILDIISASTAGKLLFGKEPATESLSVETPEINEENPATESSEEIPSFDTLLASLLK